MMDEWEIRIVGDDGTVEIYQEWTDGVLTYVPNRDPCSCWLCALNKREKGMNRNQVAQIAEDIGSSLMPDNMQWTNRFTIPSTSSSRVYTVAQRRSDGVWGCSCPSWVNRRHCKHLAEILGRLAKLEASVTDPEVVAMLRSARTAFLDLDELFKATMSTPRYNRFIDL